MRCLLPWTAVMLAACGGGDDPADAWDFDIQHEVEGPSAGLLGWSQHSSEGEVATFYFTEQEEPSCLLGEQSEGDLVIQLYGFDSQSLPVGSYSTYTVWQVGSDGEFEQAQLADVDVESSDEDELRGYQATILADQETRVSADFSVDICPDEEAGSLGWLGELIF